MKSLKSQNYYEILGVDRRASPDEIRSAYELSKVTFQDNSLATYSLFTDEENQEILALISRAYETLFTPELRREYDAFLDGLEREGIPARDLRPNLQPRPQALRAQAAHPRPRVAPISAPSAAASVLGSAPVASGAPAAAMSAASAASATASPGGTNGPGGANGPPAARVSGARVPRETPPEPPAEPRAEPAAPSAKDEAADKYIETVSCFTGPVLKKVRELRGLSREDIAEQTKIRKTYIEYLEEEQFKFLPAPVYVKGFITMIAGMLDLPAQRVAEEYMAYYRGNGQL